MLSILFITDYGEGYGLACKLAQEGHHVKFSVEDSTRLQRSQVEHGPKEVDRYEAHLEAADLVVFPGSSNGVLAARLGEIGKLVLGRGLQGLLDLDVLKGISALIGRPYSPVGIRTARSIWLCGLYTSGRLVDAWMSQSYNRLLDQDRGPIGPSQGCVTSSLSLEVLSSLDPLIARFRHTGLLSLEINEHGQLLQGKTDLDLDCFYSYLASVKGNLGHRLFNLVRGTWSPSPSTTSGAVKISRLDQTEVQLNTGAVKHYWPMGVQDVLGWVTASGDNPREVKRRLYRTLTNIAPIELLYRQDIGDELYTPEDV